MADLFGAAHFFPVKHLPDFDGPLMLGAVSPYEQIPHA